MTLLSLPQIMETRPPCEQCNVPGKSCLHPCKHCVRSPPCVTDARWSPTCCHFCVKAAVNLIEGNPSPCPMFEKKLHSLKTRSYKNNVFYKDLDLAVFSSVANFSLNHASPLDPSHLWPKQLLAEVGRAALKSDRPYNVFKLAHSHFVRSERIPDADALISEASKLNISPTRPRRTSSRSSSRHDPNNRSPVNRRREEDASAAATIESIMHSERSRHPVRNKAAPSFTNSKHDRLFEEEGEGDGDRQEYVPIPLSHQLSRSPSTARSSSPDQRNCFPSDGELSDSSQDSEDQVSDLDFLGHSPPRFDDNEPSGPPADAHSQRDLTPSPLPNASSVSVPAGNPVETSAHHADLPPGIFLSEDTHFSPPASSRVLNPSIAKLEFINKVPAPNTPGGWCLMANPYIFDSTYFSFRTVGEMTIITPTTLGASSPHFLSLFNSFREFIETESEKSRRQRDHTYNQMLALFHKDGDGSMRAKLGWDAGPKNKQVLTSKIPPAVIDFMEKKDSPPRRPVKPALYFVGKEGTPEAKFLKTINSKHSTKIVQEASVFRGEFWDPKKISEDALDQSRIRLQRASNISMCSQAIVDMAEIATSSALAKPEAELRDIIQKISPLASEVVRLVEPTLISSLGDYSRKKKEVRSQMIRGLKPARISDPLLHAEVFSNDLNVFPEAVQKSTSNLALSVDESKLCLPRALGKPRTESRLPYSSKRSHPGRQHPSSEKKRKLSSEFQPTPKYKPPAAKPTKNRASSSGFRGNKDQRPSKPSGAKAAQLPRSSTKKNAFGGDRGPSKSNQ